MIHCDEGKADYPAQIVPQAPFILSADSDGARGRHDAVLTIRAQLEIAVADLSDVVFHVNHFNFQVIINGSICQAGR